MKPNIGPRRKTRVENQDGAITSGKASYQKEQHQAFPDSARPLLRPILPLSPRQLNVSPNKLK